MANASTKIAEQLTRHGVDLIRIEAGLQKEVTGMIANLRRTLGKRIADIDPTEPARRIYRDLRLTKLLKMSEEEIAAAYKEAKKYIDAEMIELASLEQEHAIQAFNKSIGVELVTKRLDRNVLSQLAKGTLIKGAPSSAWWAGQDKKLRDSFEQNIREGMLFGENNQQLAQRIRGTRARNFKDGIMQTATHNANALIRTSVQTVANEARFAVYEENADVVKGVEWRSTLDTKTSDICKALDNQRWRLDGTKMKGTTANFTRPPAHWQCRSTLTPIVKSWEELNANPKMNKILKDAPNRQRMRSSLDGAIPAETDYEEWLRGRPEADQIKALGKTKHKLWKEGKLGFRDLIDQNHNPISARELALNLSDEAKNLEAFVSKYGVPGEAKTITQAQEYAKDVLGSRINTYTAAALPDTQRIEDTAALLKITNAYVKEIDRLAKINPKIGHHVRLAMRNPIDDAAGMTFTQHTLLERGAKERILNNGPRIPIFIHERMADKKVNRLTFGFSGYDKSLKVESHLNYTIRHELGHTLTHYREKVRLEDYVEKLTRTNALGETVPATIFGRREHIEAYVSRYGGTNWQEAIAEMFAIKTAPNYVVGTMPKALEDIVDDMLNNPRIIQDIAEDEIKTKYAARLNLLPYIILEKGQTFEVKGDFWDDHGLEDEHIIIKDKK